MKLKNDAFLFAVLILIAGLMFYFFSPKNYDMDLSHDSRTTTIETENRPSATTVSVPTVDRPATNQTGEVPPLNPEQAAEKFESQTLSQKTLKEFSDLTHLDARLPENLSFVPMDLDDGNLAGVYGRSENMAMAVVASRINPDQDQLKKYLSSKDTGIPNLDNSDLVGMKLENVPAVPGNGLKDAQVWVASNSKGEDVRIALAPREDGQGTYMIVLTAPSGELMQGEDYFDELYQNFKAKPVNK